jgi:hypothetical protein
VSHPDASDTNSPLPIGGATAHLAIIHRRFLRMILEGTKTAEARLSKTRRLPYKGLEDGERVYLKPPGGPICAHAIADRVHRFEIAGEADLRRVRGRFWAMLGGSTADDYWEAKAEARYATIVELAAVTPIDEAPVWYRPARDRSAWRLLRAA